MRPPTHKPLTHYSGKGPSPELVREALQRACTITAEDLAVFIGPGPHNPNY